MGVPLNIVNLGMKSFSHAYTIQKAISTKLIERMSGIKYKNKVITELKPQEEEVLNEVYGGNNLIIVQHPSVYTVGMRKEQRPCAKEIEYLEAKGAQYVVTDRGGLITFHGPGQLVAYPVISLKDFDVGMRTYVQRLEISLIDTCTCFNVEAGTTGDTGVWIGNNKIGAIGVNARRYVTTHGVSLNADTDLTWYDHITACGLNEKGTTSLSVETKRNITVEDVIPKFISCFTGVFNADIISSIDIK